MAYQVTFEKGTVSQQQNGIFTVPMSVTVNDGTSDVFVTSITGKYNPNASDLNAIKAEIMKELQERWDKFVAEDNLKGSAALDAALADMQAQATAYVNQP